MVLPGFVQKKRIVHGGVTTTIYEAIESSDEEQPSPRDKRNPVIVEQEVSSEDGDTSEETSSDGSKVIFVPRASGSGKRKPGISPEKSWPAQPTEKSAKLTITGKRKNEISSETQKSSDEEQPSPRDKRNPVIVEQEVSSEDDDTFEETSSDGSKVIFVPRASGTRKPGISPEKSWPAQPNEKSAKLTITGKRKNEISSETPKHAKKGRTGPRPGPAPSTVRASVAPPTPPPPPARKGKQPKPRALKEIKKYQSSTGLLILKAPFERLVRETIVRVSNRTDYRVQPLAMEALQTSAEAFIVGRLEVSNLLTVHAKRVTLKVRDMELAKRIAKDDDE